MRDEFKHAGATISSEVHTVRPVHLWWRLHELGPALLREAGVDGELRRVDVDVDDGKLHIRCESWKKV